MYVGGKKTDIKMEKCGEMRQNRKLIFWPISHCEPQWGDVYCKSNQGFLFKTYQSKKIMFDHKEMKDECLSRSSSRLLLSDNTTTPTCSNEQMNQSKR